MRSIMDYVRAWRRRFGHPPRMDPGGTMATMPVGKGGYVVDIGVDSGGLPFVADSEDVLWEPDYLADHDVVWVERTADDAYGVTVRRGRHFPASEKQPAVRTVRFTSLYEARDLVHPHRDRVVVERLRLLGE